MGLTFPWERCCMDFLAAISSIDVLVVLACCREAVFMLSLTAGISLQPQSHLDPCILNENAKASQSVLHMEPRLQAACQRAAVYLYYQLLPSSWFESITVLVIISKILQVLHLMNKMNLPCPFGPVTPRPPMVSLFTLLLDGEEDANGLSSVQMVWI